MTFCLGAALFGAMILMPLYFQTIRGEDAIMTGILLIPQGIGGGLGMFLSGRFTERFGAGRTSFFGGLILAAATIPFVLVTDTTPFATIGTAMLLPRHRRRPGDHAGDDRGVLGAPAREGQRRQPAADRAAARRRLARNRDHRGRPPEPDQHRPHRGRRGRRRSATPTGG